MRLIRVAVVIVCLCVAVILVSRLPSIHQVLSEVENSMNKDPEQSAKPLLGDNPFAGIEGECVLRHKMKVPPDGPPDVDFRRVPDTNRMLEDTVHGKNDMSTTICNRGFRFAYADKRYGTAENPHPFSRATGADDAMPTVGADEANAYAREICNGNQPMCAFSESGTQDIEPDAARDRARWAALPGWDMYDSTVPPGSTPPQYNLVQLPESYFDLPRPLQSPQSAEEIKRSSELGWLRSTYHALDDAAGARESERERLP